MTCEDENASPVGLANDQFAIKCVCNEGYISSTISGVKTELDDGEFCISTLASSNIDATFDTITISLDPVIGSFVRASDLEVHRHGASLFILFSLISPVNFG